MSLELQYIYIYIYIYMSLKIFALTFLLNESYIMLVLCNIGHSCLTRSDVTLLKSNERANFTIKRHNDQFSKFFSKGQIILDFFNVLINIRKICFNSRTLYTSPIYFAYRFWNIYRNKFWHIYILIRVWLKWLKCSDFPAYWGGLFKYDCD